MSQAGVWVIFLLGSLTAFDPLSIDMYLPAFPHIGKDLGVSSAQVELTLSSFFIGLALGTLIYGPISDRYGRKKPLLVGMAIYTVSSFACAYCHSIHMLIFFRVMQAIGGCAGMVICRSIVRDVFEKQRAAQIFSMLVQVMGAAPVLAPMVGGYILKFFGWRAIFMVLGILSSLSWVCSLLFLPETHPSLHDRPSILSSVKAAGNIIRDKEFMGFAMTGASVISGMFAYIAGSPFVFIVLFGVRPERYGWIFGMNAAGIITASQINRLLLKKFPLESILRVVTCCSCAFGIALFVASRLGHSLAAVLIPLFLYIASIGFTTPNTTAGALASQGSRAGTSSSLLGCMQWSAAFLVSVLVSTLHNGTSGPMTGLICTSGILGFSVFRIAGPKRKFPLRAGARAPEVVSSD